VQASTSVLRARHDNIRYNWGFRFALWCALLWGFGYSGMSLLAHSSSFNQALLLQGNPFFSGTVMVLVLSVTMATISIIWVAVNGQLREWFRLLTSFRPESLTYLAATLFGGCAVWLSYVAANMLDATFAVAMTMFYPVVGTFIARIWYREKVTTACWIGLVIILLGCVILYLPSLPLDQGSRLLILLLGILVGIGWAIEGVVATRAMDVTDSGVGLSLRFTYEALIWIVIAICVTIFKPDLPLLASVQAVIVIPQSALLFFTVAISLTINYLAWYKSFMFCGVCRGLAVSDISGFVTVGISLILVASQPSVLEVTACVCMAIGVFIVFYGQSAQLQVLRDVDLTARTHGLKRRRNKALTLKTQTLLTIAEAGECWDFEVADLLTTNTGKRRQSRQRKQIRVFTIEAAAAGLLTPMDEDVDDGSHFSEGKLLSRYALTAFGFERLQQIGVAEDVLTGTNTKSNTRSRTRGEAGSRARGAANGEARGGAGARTIP
jgi:drug/metabolite transporter (DMT)-like permease